MAGRPTKYKAEFVKVAQKMCELGATDVDICDALDINIATLYRWKAKHPAFCEAIKAGKEPADDRVEMSLYRKAVGYVIDAEKPFHFQGDPFTVPYREFIQPDTAAAIFWLKNRRPDKWRANPEEGGGEDLAKALAQIADKMPG